MSTDLQRRDNQVTVLEASFKHWLRENGLEDLHLTIERMSHKDAVQLQLTTMVYARQEFSGLMQAQMSREKFINVVENSIRANMLQMAAVCEEMAEKLRQGAK